MVTRNFPPLMGGMERLNQRIAEALAVDRRVDLCGPAGCAEFAKCADSVREAPIKPLFKFLRDTGLNAWRAASRKPHWVLAGSGLTAPMAWLAARRCGARSAVYLHGLDIVVPSRIYQMIWLPFIRRFDRVLVNSRNTLELAVQRGVPRDRISVLNPGAEAGPERGNARETFRNSYGLGSASLLLSVGRLTRRKGLAEFVSRSLSLIVEQQAGTILVVIGGEAENALHGVVGGERERILALAQASGVEANIRFLPGCDDDALSQAYLAADCHVFPVLDVPGDVEGFGMVALEAAAHGLSTVAFRVGGVADAVQDGISGNLVSGGDYTGFAQAVVDTLALGAETKARRALASRSFAAGLAWPEFGKKLRMLLEPLPDEPGLRADETKERLE